MTHPNVESKTTLALIEALGRDDDAASELIRHSSQRLETLARHMLRGYPALRRWVETNDVLQNALVRLIRALQQVVVESPRHFLSLSALQIRRELIDLTRHHFGPRGVGANFDSHAVNDDSHGDNLEFADLSHEPNCLAQWSELHEQIGALPQAERETMGLLYYDGLNQAEAAKILGVSTRTVQRRWHAALLLLHDKVADLWPDT